MKTDPFVPLRYLRACRLVLLACVLLGLSAALAAPVAKVNFDVPAGEAGQTLKQFAAQAKREILFPVQPVNTVKTAAVQGELTVKEGLDRLLAGTELTAIEDAKTGAIVVKRDASPNVPSRPQPNEAPAKVEDGKLVLDKFEVFGRKSINADLPRSRDDVQPYVVFGHDQIAASSVNNLEEFFRTRLPMATSFGPGSQAGGASNGTSILLRGLDSNQTLILVDGRRLPPRPTSSGNSVQADINGIPVSMIERVEILPSTASGIYGGGATGGVINIITRKDYSGVELGYTYATPFATDASTRRVDLNGSYSLEGGKTFLTFGISHSDGTRMLVQDSPLPARGLALQLKNNPGLILNSATPFFGYTTNIRAANGSDLVLKNGTALNSPITSVPVGYAGVGSDGGAALVANAGKYNLALPNTLAGGLGNRVVAPTVDSVTLSARRSFGDRVEVYVDGSNYRNRGRTPSSATGNSATLAATAPNNPFTTAIRVAFPLTNQPEVWSVNKSDSARLAAGIVVKLPHEWSAGLDYVWSRSYSLNRAASNILGDPDGSGPGLSFATAVATGVLDVMRDLNASPLNYTPYLNPSPWFQQQGRLIANEYTLRATGPVWQLPGGPVTLSTSAQLRDETIPSIVNISSTTNPTPNYTYSPEVSNRARAYYAEAKVPVFGAQGSGWRRNLELQLSARRDESTVHGRADLNSLPVTSLDGPFPTVTYRDRDFSATKSTVGFKYAPLADFAIRASLGTGFLAPTPVQLAPSAPFPLTGFPIADPKRGGATTPLSFALTSGGNPNLQPEESKSTSAGLVFTPRWLPRFRLSVDLTRIDKTDEINVQLSPQDAVNAEAYIQDRITRAALTPADQALGYTAGAITAIDISNINMARKRITAYDVQADYTLAPQSWGNLQFYGLGTYMPEYAYAVQPTAPLFNAAGGQGIGGIWVKWKWNGGFNWTKGPWTAGWNTQYIASHLGYQFISPTNDALAILNLGNNGTIPAMVYHDVSLSYKTGGDRTGWRWLIANSQFTVGVQNVFNTRPTAIPVTSWTSVAWDNLGDARLARYTLSFRRHF